MEVNDRKLMYNRVLLYDSTLMQKLNGILPCSFNDVGYDFSE